MDIKERLQIFAWIGKTQITAEYNSVCSLHKFNQNCRRAEQWKKQHPTREAQVKFARATSKAVPLIQQSSLPTLNMDKRLDLVDQALSCTNGSHGDAHKTVLIDAFRAAGQAEIARIKMHRLDTRQTFYQLVKLLVINK